MEQERLAGSGPRQHLDHLRRRVTEPEVRDESPETGQTVEGDRETGLLNGDQNDRDDPQEDRVLGFTEVAGHLDEALGQPDDAQVSPELELRGTADGSRTQ
jgi:hypothetical protein